MKKYIAIIFAVVMAAILALPCAASDAVGEVPTEAISEAVSETMADVEGDVNEGVTEPITENITDAIAEVESEDITVNIGEVQEIIEQSASFSDAVVAIAGKLGVSVSEAEELVSAMQSLGDKYLGETALWDIIKQDMATYPEKYVAIALVLLMLITLVIFMLRWIVSNIGQMRSLKMNVASLKKSLDGDEEGEGNSLRALISGGNVDVVKLLSAKNADLQAKIDDVTEKSNELKADIEKAKANTDAALAVMQETAVQIAQLLYIAMDKGKMPTATKETRQIWFDNTRSKILDAAKVKEAEASDDGKAEKDIPEV